MTDQIPFERFDTPMRPEFRDALRARFVAAVDAEAAPVGTDAAAPVVDLRAPAPPPSRSRLRLVLIAAGVIAILAATASIVRRDAEDDLVAAPPLRIGVAVHEGGASNLLNADVFAALARAGASVPLSVAERPYLSSWEPPVRYLADRDAQIVIVPGGFTSWAADGVAAVAADHPETRFVLVGSGASGPNVTTLDLDRVAPGYLAGVAAATASESGHLGFIGGTRSTVLDAYRRGFVAGARQVDPDVVVDDRSLRDDDLGLNARGAARTAADEVYASGADVIVVAAGASTAGVDEAARAVRASGRMVGMIAIEGRAWAAVAGDQPHRLLTIDTDVARGLADAVVDAADGRLDAGARRLGVAEGYVGFEAAAGQDALAARIERLSQQIADGTHTLPEEP